MNSILTKILFQFFLCFEKNVLNFQKILRTQFVDTFPVLFRWVTSGLRHLILDIIYSTNTNHFVSLILQNRRLVTAPKVWIQTQSTDDRQWLSSTSDGFTHIRGTTRATDSTDMSELSPCFVGRRLLMTDYDCPLLLIFASVVRHESPIRWTCLSTTCFRGTLEIWWQFRLVCSLICHPMKTDNDCPLLMEALIHKYDTSHRFEEHVINAYNN